LLPRERFNKALNFEEPDRAPIDLGSYQSGMCWKAYLNLKNYLTENGSGLQINSHPNQVEIFEPHQGLAKVDEGIKELLGIDTRYVFPQPPSHYQEGFEHGNGETRHTDWLGVTWIKSSSSEYFDPMIHPLSDATKGNLDNYNWPEPGSRIVNGVVDKAKYLHESTDYAIGTTIPGLYETSWYMTGLERMLKAWGSDIEFVKSLLDKMLSVLADFYEIYLGEIGQYLDFVAFYEDIGGQKDPVFNPEQYRAIVKPRTSRLVSLIKEIADVKVAHHCCGVIRPFLEDIIETGVDIINPVQVTATGNEDTESLNRDFGNRIAFWGAIDTQRTLPFGTPSEVRDEVLRRLDDLAPGGGYLLASVHNIQNDVPPENILAMFETAKEWSY